MLHPILEEMSDERSEAEIVEIDVDESPETSKKYGVMSIPTLILFKDGVEVSKKVGFTSKEQLIDWIKENQ
jgi:thioredoxin 1